MNDLSLDLFVLTASFWVFAGCKYDGSLVHIVLKRICVSCQRIVWLLAAYQVALMARNTHILAVSLYFS